MYRAWVIWTSPSITCRSLTEGSTGMKCLPESKISRAHGVVLHDWHAETVAIRSLNYFLLKECQVLISSQNGKSQYVRKRRPSELTDAQFQPFTINKDINLHMY